jgi:hypothetical protein
MSYDENVLAEFSRVTRWNSCHLSKCLVKNVKPIIAKCDGRKYRQDGYESKVILPWVCCASFTGYLTTSPSMKEFQLSQVRIDCMILYVSTWCSFFHQHHRIIDFSKQRMTDWSGPAVTTTSAFSIRRCRVVGNTPVTASGFTRIVLRLTTVMG